MCIRRINKTFKLQCQCVVNVHARNEFNTLYLRWKFLGLSEKTHPSPVSVAEYKMKVTYCGPRSPQICDYIKQVDFIVIL